MRSNGFCFGAAMTISLRADLSVRSGRFFRVTQQKSLSPWRRICTSRCETVNLWSDGRQK